MICKFCLIFCIRKNEGFQTPQISPLHMVFSEANAPKVSFGAQNEIFFKLFESLFSELKRKEDVINTFYAQLKYTANFNEPLKQKFFSEILSPVEYQTFNI
jgi:hypothetical protein